MSPRRNQRAAATVRAPKLIGLNGAERVLRDIRERAESGTVSAAPDNTPLPKPRRRHGG
jgi:hypothetical protein